MLIALTWRGDEENKLMTTEQDREERNMGKGNDMGPSHSYLIVGERRNTATSWQAPLQP